MLVRSTMISSAFVLALIASGCALHNVTPIAPMADTIDDWNKTISLRTKAVDVKKDGKFVITYSILSRKTTGKKLLIYCHEKQAMAPTFTTNIFDTINILDKDGELIAVLEVNNNGGGLKNVMVFNGGDDPVGAFGESDEGILVPVTKDKIRHLWPVP